MNLPLDGYQAEGDILITLPEGMEFVTQKVDGKQVYTLADVQPVAEDRWVGAAM